MNTNMLQELTIAFIGNGPRSARGEKLHARHGVRVTTDNVAAASKADTVAS